MVNLYILVAQSTGGEQPYIGGERNFNQSDSQWTYRDTNTTLTYFNWDTIKTNKVSKKIAYIKLMRGSNYSWIMGIGESSRRFICEIVL